MTQDDRPEFWELLTLDELRERYSVRGELDGLSPKEQEDRLEFIRWCMAIGILEEDGTSWMGHRHGEFSQAAQKQFADGSKRYQRWRRKQSDP